MSTVNEWMGRRVKYRDPDYDDEEVQALMKYFQIEDYPEFVEFVKNARKGA